MNEISDKRDISVDIVKGIAIMAVVFGHIGFEWPNVQISITNMFAYLWHVPVFYMISGFFLGEGYFVNPFVFINKRVIPLYKLVLYYSISAVLLHNVLNRWGWYKYSNDIINTDYSYFDYCTQIVKTLLLANSETIIGPSWFVNILLMALLLYALISFILNKYICKKDKVKWIRFIISIGLCSISCIVSNRYHFALHRIYIAFTVLFLLCIGRIIYPFLKSCVNNPMVILTSVIVFLHYLFMEVHHELSLNSYQNMITLVVSSISAIIIIYRFASDIQNYYLGRVIAKIGKESFHIMMLHFVSFQLVREAFSMQSKYVLGGVDNLFYVFVFFVSGILLPIIAIYSFRKIKNFIINK